MMDLKKTVRVKSSKVHIDPEEIYYRLMTVNANKKMTAFRLHSFELSPVPLSMFTYDGSMIFTNKSEYMHKFEELAKPDIIKVYPKSECTCYHQEITCASTVWCHLQQYGRRIC